MPILEVAHDIICPWCWVGRIQAKKLRNEFPGLSFIWKGYELLPAGMEYNPPAPDPNAPVKPRTPSRFELLLAADGLVLPERLSYRSVSRMALEGAEYALEVGRQEEYLDGVYNIYWEEDRDISDPGVLAKVAEDAGLNVDEFMDALKSRKYKDSVVEYDEPAHAAGIWNVPTWKFPAEWVAEQPYTVLREMMQQFIKDSSNG